MTYSRSIILLLSCTCMASISACTPDSPYPYVLLEEDNVTSEPDYCQRGIHPIENSSDAYQVSSMIKNTIEETVKGMSDGVYSEEMIVDAYGGTFIVTGIISRIENEVCGADCMTSYQNHSIIATMSSYQKYSASIITGTINYTDDTGKQYTEEGATVFGNITVTDNGESIYYERVYLPYDCLLNDIEIGIVDTIYAITSSWDPEWIYSQNGLLTSTGGTFVIE